MKVSVVIPTYNSQEFVSFAINSVLSQTYQDIECVVIDGGSKDNTINILKGYGDKIIFISEKDNGVFDALNKGIKLAKGEVIGWLGSDDFYANNGVVDRAVLEIKEKNIDICWGDLLYVKRDSPNQIVRFWKSSEYKKNGFRHGWQLPHFASFIKKDVFQKCGYFRDNLKIAADYEFFLRLLEVHKISSSYIEQVFLKMRMGGQSNISIKGNIECYKAWQLNGLSVNPLSIFLPKIFIKIGQYIRKP